MNNPTETIWQGPLTREAQGSHELAPLVERRDLNEWDRHATLLEEAIRLRADGHSFVEAYTTFTRHYPDTRIGRIVLERLMRGEK